MQRYSLLLILIVATACCAKDCVRPSLISEELLRETMSVGDFSPPYRSEKEVFCIGGLHKKLIYQTFDRKIETVTDAKLMVCKEDGIWSIPTAKGVYNATFPRVYCTA